MPDAAGVPTIGDVLWSWASALAWVACAIGAGVVAGLLCRRTWGMDSLGVTTWAQYAAIALLLWATFGHAGWSIQTFDGNTPAEILNERFFKAVHLVATTLLAFSIAWPQPGRFG